MIEGGRSAADILGELDDRRGKEPAVHGGRLFGLVYPTGRHDLEELLVEVNNRYLFGNALNPFKFPELAALEKEVVGMVGDMVHLTEGGGCMTSGGTESILMSMLVNRERARARGVEHAEIVVPHSAHPAYAKAAHYFDLTLVSVPLDEAYRADVAQMATAINENTAVVVASAFNYPFGVMDPVDEIAALAKSRGVGCHVDACIGSFVLPFLERLGYDVPPWDFRVDGVTEMSADVHKYGYCPKGASVVLHNDPDWFMYQGFVYDQWPSGLYGSAAIAGARPAAPIATAWTVLNHLGMDGYVEMAEQLMASVKVMQDGIDSIDGLDPDRRSDRSGVRVRVGRARHLRHRRCHGRQGLAPQPQPRAGEPARDAFPGAQRPRQPTGRRPPRRDRQPQEPPRRQLPLLLNGSKPRSDHAVGDHRDDVIPCARPDLRDNASASARKRPPIPDGAERPWSMSPDNRLQATASSPARSVQSADKRTSAGFTLANDREPALELVAGCRSTGASMPSRAIPFSWERQAMAATLTTRGAVLSGRSAAALHGIDGFRPGRLEITVPRRRSGVTRLATFATAT